MIVAGGREFRLQNRGHASCAVSYEGGFVTIGGNYPTHGKVDR